TRSKRDWSSDVCSSDLKCTHRSRLQREIQNEKSPCYGKRSGTENVTIHYRQRPRALVTFGTLAWETTTWLISKLNTQTWQHDHGIRRDSSHGQLDSKRDP